MGRVLATLFEGLSGYRRRFDVATGTNADPISPVSSDPSSLRDVLVVPDSLTEAGQRRRWLRACVEHRAAHSEYGTGEWVAADGSGLPAWLAAAVGTVLKRYATPSDLYYSLPSRFQFAQVVEYVEDLRIETRSCARYRGIAADISFARALDDHEFEVPPPLAARSRMTYLLRELSRGRSHPLEIGIDQERRARLLGSLLAQAQSAAVGFAEAFVLASGIHYLVLGTPFMAAKERTVTLPGDSADCWYHASDAELASTVEAALALAHSRPVAEPDVPREGEELWTAVTMRPSYRDSLDDLYVYNRALSSFNTPKVHLFAPGRSQSSLTDNSDHHHQHHSDGDEDVRSREARRSESPWEVGQLAPLGGDALADLSRRMSDLRGQVSYEPEWDYIDGVYLPRWCRVVAASRESPESRAVGVLASGPAYLESDDAVVDAIGRRLREWPAAGHRWSDIEADGPDIAVDQYVRAWVGSRVGEPMSDEFYRGRLSDEPDVVSLCCLDLSLSTARRIAFRDETGADGTTEAAIRDDRVVDLEARAALTLSDLLDGAGQDCGIYGFWSGGRQDVRLVPLKPLGARRRQQFRLERDLVNPTGGTRLAAAIRRTSRLLDDEEAETRILIAVCDGRPFDNDYGKHHGDTVDMVTYALHDTVAALGEARRRGQLPRLLVCGGSSSDLIQQVVPAEYLTLVADPSTLADGLIDVHRAVLTAHV